MNIEKGLTMQIDKRYFLNVKATLVFICQSDQLYSNLESTLRDIEVTSKIVGRRL